MTDPHNDRIRWAEEQAGVYDDEEHGQEQGATSVSFFAYGTPAPQGSKKHVGRGIMIEASKDLPAWRQAIMDAAQDAHQGAPLDGPLSVQLDVYLPKPKRPRFNVPATGLDLDKLQRAVGDSLEKAGVIANDARICRWDAQKHYAAGNRTGAHITIKETP